MIKSKITLAVLVKLMILMPFMVIAQNDLEGNIHFQKQNLATAEDYLKVSEYYLKLSESDSISKYTSLGKAVVSSKQKTIALLYLTESLNYFEKGDFKSALEEINFSENIFKDDNTLNKSEKYGEILYIKGDYLKYLNKNAQSLEYLLKAEKIVNNPNKKAGIYGALSTTHLNYNNLEKSLFYVNKILSEPLNSQIDDIYTAQAYASASMIYELENEFKKALNYDLKAIKILKNKSENFNLAAAYVNAASTLKRLDENKKSLVYLDSAKHISKNINNNYLKYSIKLITAENYVALNINKQAHQLFKESIEEFQRIGVVDAYVEGCLEQSKLYFKQSRYDSAIELAKKGLKSARENQLPVFEKEANLLLYRIFKIKKVNTKALLYYEQFVAINDLILKEEKRKEIENIKINFDVRSLETQLQLKNDQLTINEEKRKSAIYFNLLLSIGVITLLFSSYRQLKLSKTKKLFFEAEKQLSVLKSEKMELDIENKNKEVTNFAIHINEKNETLSKIRKDILKINKTIDQPNKTKLRNIVSNIDNTIQVNQEKAQLYAKIDEVKNSFYDTIKLRYPDLSNREIEISTYLRLNLSSKQIANHLNISQLTINNYRFKIRKKLKLDKDDDLINFLKKI